MEHTRSSVIESVRGALLHTDISLLNQHGVADDRMALIAAEHAARVETLAKAIDPSLGRPLLLMVASALMAAATEIGDATFIEPELHDA